MESGSGERGRFSEVLSCVSEWLSMLWLRTEGSSGEEESRGRVFSSIFVRIKVEIGCGARVL